MSKAKAATRISLDGSESFFQIVKKTISMVATEQALGFVVNTSIRMLEEAVFTSIRLNGTRDYRERRTLSRFLVWVKDQPAPFKSSQYRVKAFSTSTSDDPNPIKRAQMRKNQGIHMLPAQSIRHYFYYEGKIFWYISYPVEKERILSDEHDDEGGVLITTFSTNKHLLSKLLEEFSFKEKPNILPIFNVNSQGCCQFIGEFAERHPLTIAHDQNEIQEIFDEIEDTFNRQEDFDRCGFNWKYNLLLVGKPGTGKTSLAKVIASKLGMPINFINLADTNNEALVRSGVSLRGELIFLDEIDLCEAVYCRPEMLDERLPAFRKPIAHAKPVTPRVTENQTTDSPDAPLPEGVTSKRFQYVDLSTILGFLDGVYSPRGSIIIMATNRPEVLDAAITRIRRVDKIVFMDDSKHEDIVPYVEFLFKKKVPDHIRFDTVNGAKLSHFVNTYREDFDGFLEAMPKA